MIVAYIIAEIQFKATSNGGRVTMPSGSGYAPYLRTCLVSEDLAVRVNNIPPGAMFEEKIIVAIELTYYPKVNYGLMNIGVPIKLVEGPKVVAEGVCKSGIIEKSNVEMPLVLPERKKPVEKQ